MHSDLHTGRWLVLIVLIVAVAVWLDLPGTTSALGRSVGLRKGLDLQGGAQVLLEADVSPDQDIDPQDMRVARTIIENRVNGLGVTEAVVQIQGERRIIVELPGIRDADEAVRTIQATALLEFIEGDAGLRDGQLVYTTHGAGKAAAYEGPGPGVIRGPFETVMTGEALRDAGVDRDQLGKFVVAFTLRSEWAGFFE